MPDQSYKNHSRYVPLYHFVTTIILIALLIGSIINLCHSAPENKYSASLIIVIVIVLILLWAFVRTFPLRVQDRAIRAEEQLRHFILTGKPLNNGLSIHQIIALRFASDEEFPALAQKAATENLDAKSIKEAIKNWRADHHRA